MKRFVSILLTLCLMLSCCAIATTAMADIKVSGVVLNTTSRNMHKGKTYTLVATVYPENATTKTLTWSSSNKNVAIVEKIDKTTAVVTAISDGTCVITCKAKNGNASATCTITVKTPVTEIKLRKSEKLIGRGSTYNLYPTVYPEDATNRNLKWTTSNKAVATVSDTGAVKGINPGTCTITATAKDGSGVSASCVVTVRDFVTSLSLPESKIVALGTNFTMSPTIKPTFATEKTLIWESSNPEVATVSDKGYVRTLSAGETVITATTVEGATASGTLSASMLLKVRIYIESITLNKTSRKMTRGSGWTLKVASYEPEDATRAKFLFSSSDPTVAKVNETTGRVTALKDGTATITCKANDGSGVTATCVITVRTPVESLTLDKNSRTMEAGSTCNLVATVLPSDATNTGVLWRSSDPDVATVSSSGRVTAVGNGTCVITAISKDNNDLYDTCNIRVKTSVTSIKLTVTELNLVEGDSWSVKATVYPEDATDKDIYWSSTDESVATVSQNGVITGEGSGTCYIYVNALDGSKVQNKILVVVK